MSDLIDRLEVIGELLQLPCKADDNGHTLVELARVIRVIYELPTSLSAKHERLIDADNLEREACHGCEHEHNKNSNCIDCSLANAPTIVLAEGKESART